MSLPCLCITFACWRISGNSFINKCFPVYDCLPFCYRCWWCLNRPQYWSVPWRWSRPWCSFTYWSCSRCRPSTWGDSGGRATWRQCPPSTRKCATGSMMTGLTETVCTLDLSFIFSIQKNQVIKKLQGRVILLHYNRNSL